MRHLWRAHAQLNTRMQIALQSPARKMMFLGTCLALTAVYLGLAARAFLADHFSQQLDLASLQMAARLEPANAEYQYRLGHYFLQTQHEPETAVQFFKSATALNPHNASYWFELSRAYQRLASPDQQKDALQHAIAADPSTPDVAWDAANLYWSLGETDKALQEFRVVLENDPYLPLAALDRCWRIKPDVNALLRDVVPRKADTYSTFLDFLISRNEAGCRRDSVDANGATPAARGDAPCFRLCPIPDRPARSCSRLIKRGGRRQVCATFLDISLRPRISW